MYSKSKTHQGQVMSIALILVLLFSLLLPSSTQPARAQDAPILHSPAEGALTTISNYPPLGIPEVSWYPAPGATLYRVQFSADIGFANIPLNITTVHTSYTPLTVTTSLFTDGTWYWRVRVEQPSVGEFSEVRSFNKLWGSVTNFPSLTHPEEGAALDFYDYPTFSWQPVMGAASYRFQIATSETGFNSPVYTAASILTTSHQPLLKLSNGIYYWQVTPLDPGGNAGQASPVRSFIMSYGVGDYSGIEVPWLVEPADNSEPVFTPTFRWSAIPGAQTYRLEYTSAPNCNFAEGTAVETRNTTYTPTVNFPNDQNYCWRVRANSGSSVSDWSDTWEFTKKWYIQPILLTPTNLYQTNSTPYFSWTPVPGASRYQIQVSSTNSFVTPIFSATTANTHYIRIQSPGFLPVPGSEYFWRVIPVDRDGNNGLESAVFSFRGGTGSPQLVSPLYYYDYPPASYPENAVLNPKENRSFSIPIFMWHRLLDDTMTNQAPKYRLEVSQDDPYFTAPVWMFETENLSAVPLFDTFSPLSPETDYYWRVKSKWDDGRPEPWSQIWRTRIDSSKMLPATSTITPLRPIQGYEFAETAPLLEWYPLEGAESYQVQVSIDPTSFDEDFLVPTSGDSTTVRVSYPAYTPLRKLDYYPDHASDLSYGTYYWRVCGLDSGGEVIGSWSTPWRFQVAAQSHWRASRTIGTLDDELQRQIGYSPVGETSAYDLTTLYAAQTGSSNESYWYFGFHAPSANDPVNYGLYIDLDHQDYSGAFKDPLLGEDLTTIPAHRPEFVIYITPSGGTFLPENVKIYPWGAGDWGFYSRLDLIGGELSYDQATQYLEIKVPDTAIGMSENTSSASLSLISVNSDTQTVQDTVPVGSLTTLNRFATISGRLTLAMPPNNDNDDFTKLPTILPFFWHLPIDVPWFGYRVQVGIDPSLTNWLYTLTVTGSSLAYPEFTYFKDFNGDNTYYWRVRPAYSSTIFGAWSDVGRFERDGFEPKELRESVTFATPTFTWNGVEGAESYDLQVSTDSNFSALQFGTINTTQITYTPVATLANGTYYWRVRANRNGGISNDWSMIKEFTLSLPTPTLFEVGNVVSYAPTMCWEPILQSDGGIPVLSAWKYRLETSTTANFSTVFERVDTEQTCYTPAKGYPDGTYYWRVAMIDGNNRLGPFSSFEYFTKQYPVTTLTSPTPGSRMPVNPTFVWTPVQGAAKYQIEIANNANFSPVFESVTTVNTRYSSVKTYNPETAYFWRIAMIDKDGKLGPFTGATTLPPAETSKMIFTIQVRKTD